MADFITFSIINTFPSFPTLPFFPEDPSKLICSCNGLFRTLISSLFERNLAGYF